MSVILPAMLRRQGCCGRRSAPVRCGARTPGRAGAAAVPQPRPRTPPPARPKPLPARRGCCWPIPEPLPRPEPSPSGPAQPPPRRFVQRQSPLRSAPSAAPIPRHSPCAAPARAPRERPAHLTSTYSHDVGRCIHQSCQKRASLRCQLMMHGAMPKFRKHVGHISTLQQRWRQCFLSLLCYFCIACQRCSSARGLHLHEQIRIADGGGRL